MQNKNFSLDDFYKTLNILCVEDEPAILDVYETIFSSMFAHVYTARDGKEGLEIFNTSPVDIIEKISPTLGSVGVLQGEKVN